MTVPSIAAALLLVCSGMQLSAQTWPFPWPEDRIARYTARRASAPIVIDGRLDEAVWRAAERSPRFADLVGGQPGIHDTRAAVLWDDTNLYVGYWVEEPFVEATLTERDAPIYKDNDVELFIAGRDAYYEFEINAFGTIYEVLFIWEREFESSGYARRPEFDRARPGVRPFNGVGFTKHPRGPRIGYWNWDMPGLETAVHVDGTINDNKDRDRGWTVEMRIPWRSLEPLAMPDGRALPPKDGDEWRMDFSRFNTYKEAAPAKDPGGWAWSPHGVWDSHMPELFTRVRFSTAGAADVPARPQDKAPGTVSAAPPMRTEAEARARAEASRRARQEQRLKAGTPGELISEYAKANIGPVPASLGVSPFYQKYTDALGIPVIASDKVPDAALLVARDIVNAMLAARPDIRKELMSRGWRTGVIAEVEMTMDIPEYSKMKRPGAPKDEPVTQADRDYHANRSRGLGGNPTTGAEENLLGYPGTRYWGEHIFVHEFAHAIMSGAIRHIDPAMFTEIRAAYDAAMAAGKYVYADGRKHYATTNASEYWAEGVQWWFFSNYGECFTGNVTVETPEEFAAYDPALNELIGRVFTSHHIAMDVFHGKRIRPVVCGSAGRVRAC